MDQTRLRSQAVKQRFSCGTNADICKLVIKNEAFLLKETGSVQLKFTGGGVLHFKMTT